MKGYCLYSFGSAAAGPLQIKTGPNTAIAGFAEESLALRFREMFGLPSSLQLRHLVELGTNAAPCFGDGPRSRGVVFFDSPETLEAYAKDREHFPYSQHIVEWKHT